MTESLLPDEGHSEANPSKGIVGQESSKTHGAIFGDLVFLETTVCIGLLCFIILSLFLSSIYYKMKSVKNISYIFCSAKDLFSNTRTTHLKF